MYTYCLYMFEDFKLEKICYDLTDEEKKVLESCWFVHFANGYVDRPLNSDCEVVRWLPIFGDSSDILYANGEEFGRVHRYGE